MFDRPDQIRCAESIVYHDRKSVLVRDLRDCIYIRNIAVGITQRLDIDCSRVLFDGRFNLGEVMRVHKCGLYSILRKCMCQKIETSAVDRLLRYDVAAVRCQRLDRICDRRRSS